MKQEHLSEIKAIIILAVGLILLVSLISFVPGDLVWYTSQPNTPALNWISQWGAYLAGSLLFVFGYGSYFLVFILFFWGLNKLFFHKNINFSLYKFVSLVVLLCVLSSLLSLIGVQDSVLRFSRSGMTGSLASDFLVQYLGRTGAYIILGAVGMLSFILTGEFLVAPFLLRIIEGVKRYTASILEKRRAKELKLTALNNISAGRLSQKKIANRILSISDEDGVKEDRDFKSESRVKKPEKPKIHITPSSRNGADDLIKEDEIKVVGKYRLPPLDLLDDPPPIPTSKVQNDLVNGAKLLETTLANFGVDAHVADIERGPAITRYELEPAPGVKVQKFTTLSNDIALAMRAATVRVVAPIPGKNRVGIEVPNAASASVYLKDVLTGVQSRSFESKLMLSLGKDIAGKPMLADLAEMPHLLIAGTTGSGKTVCVNGIIMSLLFNTTPDEVKFVMVDPKMVELAQYNDIPHLLCPTVTDLKKASSALHWVVNEMEFRYRKLSKEGVRNIKAYNTGGKNMPYIIVIIDELADLMQVSAKTVESSITRLAQLSRAVGIHLILATQRPSVDVITGIIKANFPARISFKVASKVDSRTVLDMNGAETLLGRGDMLFIRPGDAKPTRGQCSFVKDGEIRKVIDFIKDQQEPQYDESIVTQQREGVGSSGEKDEYYDEAVRLVIETNQASVSILQRRMRLGYTRAARLIDMMEQEGIVGPYCGSKPRDILVDREQWLLDNMKKKDDGKQ